MDWTWFHKWGSPKWFYELSGKWLPWLVGAMVTCLLIGVIWALLFVPQDYQQGLTNRIFYVHVPVASISLAFFPLMAMAGTIFLVWRMKLADVVVKVAAPLGAWFTALALASGSIWGVDTWGTWWVWDARLTSMLILLFLYGGAIALDRAINDEKSAARAVAVLVLVGVVNIPIIKYSVEWWNTLHQPATFKLTEKPSMPVEMWVPLLLSVLGLYLLFGWLACLRMKTEIVVREQKTRWVRELVMAGRG